MSIGAVKLSELAKGLEFAGKKDNIIYIKSEHNTMIDEFKRVMKILDECSYLAAKEVVEEDVVKPILQEDAFEQCLVDLENAAFDLDGEKMQSLISELSAYSYGGKDLQNELRPVYKKIEMFDYMSAYEAVLKIKKKA